MARTRFESVSGTNYYNKELNISGFSGVDASTPVLSTNNNHPIDMLNYIPKDNVLQKRLGYENIFDSELNDSIYNIWKLDNSYFVHCGSGLYLLMFKDVKLGFVAGNIKIGSALKYSDYDEVVKIAPQTVSASISNSKLYIAGGIKYLRVFYKDGALRVEKVEDYAYVPTTITGITSSESKSNSGVTLDSVNLLSNRVKNELVTGFTADKTAVINRPQHYQLNLPINKENKKDINISLKYNDEFFSGLTFSTKLDRSANNFTLTASVSPNYSTSDWKAECITWYFNDTKINEKTTSLVHVVDYSGMNVDYVLKATYVQDNGTVKYNFTKEQKFNITFNPNVQYSYEKVKTDTEKYFKLKVSGLSWYKNVDSSILGSAQFINARIIVDSTTKTYLFNNHNISYDGTQNISLTGAEYKIESTNLLNYVTLQLVECATGYVFFEKKFNTMWIDLNI